MQLRILVCLLALVATPVWACEKGILTVTDWSVKPAVPNYEPGFSEVSVTYKYEGKAPIRMIDGFFLFADPLGGDAGGIPIERDQTIAPGATAKASATMPDSFLRITKLPHEDIEATSCILGIVYEDGTTKTFN